MLARLRQWWRARKTLKLEVALDELKARYQTFRTLLDANTKAVELVTDLGMRLNEGELSGDFREKAEALARTVGDMAEKFTSLEGMRSGLVEAMHLRLAAALANELSRLPEAGSVLHVFPLSEAFLHGERLCGAKAASLARFLKQGGFRVPDGFVVTAPACRIFFDHNNLALRSIRMLGPVLDGQSRSKLDQASKQLQEYIRQSPVPPALAGELERFSRPFFEAGKGLAVRSSAIAEDGRHHSFAGQFATILNVTTFSQFLDAFREVLASAFSSRAVLYRQNAGMEPLAFDMAVLCLELIHARTAGIIITRAPSGGGNYLISAVLGLGEAAVGGSCAADIFHVSREGVIEPGRTVISRKEHRLVPRIGGGIGSEPVSAIYQHAPSISDDEICMLASWAREIEKMAGGVPQDIEWAVDMGGRHFLLQARPLPGGHATTAAPTNVTGTATPALLSGGLVASPGRAIGRVHHVRRQDDFNAPEDRAPLVLVLPQSLPDAAQLINRLAAIVVKLGNPADHLANVARENGIPMLCAMAQSLTVLKDGDWVEVDAGAGCVRRADPPPAGSTPRPLRQSRLQATDPRVERFRELLTRLNLTDAYGPSFNLLECRSLHDLIRFIHEKAVLAMFEGSDELLENSGSAINHLFIETIPFPLSIIDLGGALRPGCSRQITPEDLTAPPLRALWKGLATPGLNWGPPPAGGGMGEVFSKWLTDHQADRQIGMPNYLVAGRDYLNLNARMDFHFIMVDAVAGLDSRANHIRFRFKGGGTTTERRARRARCIAEILETEGFFTNVRDDLVGASLHGASSFAIEERLTSLGRLLGFTRLLDAGMRDDTTALRAAEAFLNGDYGMESLA